MTKVCIDCEVEKPLDDFHVSSGGRLGRHARCKPCRSRYRKTLPGHAAGQDRRNAERRRRYAEDPGYRKARLDGNRSWRYGIEADEYDRLLAQQGGVCAICGSEDPAGHGHFHVDHDHQCCPGSKSCGTCVRGLLCTRCNTGIAMFGDDVEVMQQAADYIMAGLTGSGSPNLRANVSRQVPVAGAS